MAVSKRKDSRIDLRVTTEQKSIIEEAAKLKHMSASNFILDKAYEAAQEVLRERYRFSLSEHEWKEFWKALDAPVEPTSALKKLMTNPSVFENETE